MHCALIILTFSSISSQIYILFHIHPSLHYHSFCLIYGVQLLLPIYSWICDYQLAYGRSTRGFTLKKLTLPLQQLSITNISLARGETSCPGHPSMLRFLSSLNLYRSCGCCHNHCEFICATVLL